jgi:hypothetical protein
LHFLFWFFVVKKIEAINRNVHDHMVKDSLATSQRVTEITARPFRLVPCNIADPLILIFFTSPT